MFDLSAVNRSHIMISSLRTTETHCKSWLILLCVYCIILSSEINIAHSVMPIFSPFPILKLYSESLMAVPLPWGNWTWWTHSWKFNQVNRKLENSAAAAKSFPKKYQYRKIIHRGCRCQLLPPELCKGAICNFLTWELLPQVSSCLNSKPR